MIFAKVIVQISILAIAVYGVENSDTDDKSTTATKNVELTALLEPEINVKDLEVELIDESNSKESKEKEEDIGGLRNEKETKKTKKVFTTAKPMNPDVKHSCDEDTLQTTTINPFVEVFSPIEKSIDVPMKLNETSTEETDSDTSQNIIILALKPVDPITSYILHRRHIPLINLVPVRFVYHNQYFFDPYYSYQIAHYPTPYINDNDYYKLPMYNSNYYQQFTKNIPQENSDKTDESNIDNEFSETQHYHTGSYDHNSASHDFYENFY